MKEVLNACKDLSSGLCWLRKRPSSGNVGRSSQFLSISSRAAQFCTQKHSEMMKRVRRSRQSSGRPGWCLPSDPNKIGNLFLLRDLLCLGAPSAATSAEEHRLVELDLLGPLIDPD